MADTQLESLLVKLTQIEATLDRIPLNFALEIRKVAKEVLAESRIF